MAIALVELPDSRVWSGGSVKFKYRLTGTADDMVALDYLIEHTAATYQGLARQPNISCEPEWTDSVNDKGRWECSVQYGAHATANEPESEVGTVRIRVDTSGGTTHITVNSDGETNEYGPGDSCEFNGAIGVVRSGDSLSVEGVDIIVPVFNFNVTKVWGASNPVSFAGLFQVTGKVNSVNFSVTDTETGKHVSFAAGECLFLGAQVGELRSDGGYEVTYSFSAHPNKDVFINGIGTIPKKGWDYLWVYYVDGLPYHAFVEQVYEMQSFFNLYL